MIVHMDEEKRRHATYMDSLGMVTNPRQVLDADGHFVGYDAIQELLDYRLSKYHLTHEEHEALTRRLKQEQEKDPRGNDD